MEVSEDNNIMHSIEKGKGARKRVRQAVVLQVTG